MVRDIGESIALAPDFTLKIADGMPALRSPYTPLEQVFLNLISNARKHHDRPTGTIEVGFSKAGHYYEFYVRDDGPGIPAEFHERVFKMFQTLKPRDDKESSGLGLAIARKLVEWQGGRIWISSGGERGTTIRFLWPAQSSGKKEDTKNVA
jgi:signal transduction histidine kinase